MKKRNIFTRTKTLIKKRGIKGLFYKIIEKLRMKETKLEVFSDSEYLFDTKEIELNKEEMQSVIGEDRIILNWVIPEIGKGSGGHLNIFRFASLLEEKGIHNRIYIFYSSSLDSSETVKKNAIQDFPIINSNIEFFNSIDEMCFAHATIATSWVTAYYVKRFNNTFAKCYFVQDFEPYFFSHGSSYHLAENTYKFNLFGITAGDWLKVKLSNEYNMQTRSFSFSYDKDTYNGNPTSKLKNRIFFYARPYTPRRDFEIGFEALKQVCEVKSDITIVFAGEDISKYVIPFKNEQHGIMEVKDLGDIYNSCDMCLVLSSTNLSLLPLEIMASYSVPICSKGANSDWLVNDTNSIMVDYDVKNIKDSILHYYNNPNELIKIRENGNKFAKSTSWDKEAEKVKDAILEAIELGKKDLNI